MKQKQGSDEYRELLPLRTERSNKGTYGTLLLNAGSHGMAGAAILAATAAYRIGTGIVAVLSDECNRVILQGSVPEALFQACRHPAVLDESFVPVAMKATALAIGPGIGLSKVAEAVVKKVLTCVYERHGERRPVERNRIVPLIMDADALNLLSENRLSIPEPAREAGVVITPHPGEMARLTGLSVREILDDPKRIAEQYALANRLVCVLKDHRSIVTDGSRTFINPTGCDGMATAGSGDVLTGMIGGLLAQGCNALDAARLGAYLHGRAGELAEEKLGPRSVMARDIIAHIAPAVCETEEREVPERHL